MGYSTREFYPGGTPANSCIGGGVPPGCPNPDPISDQNMQFSTPVFRPDLQNPYTRFHTWPLGKIMLLLLRLSGATTKILQHVQTHFEFAVGAE